MRNNKRILLSLLAAIVMIVMIVLPAMATEPYGYAVIVDPAPAAPGEAVTLLFRLTDYTEGKSGIRGFQIDITDVGDVLHEAVCTALVKDTENVLSNTAKYQENRDIVRYAYVKMSGILSYADDSLLEVTFNIPETYTEAGTLSLPLKVLIQNDAGDKITYTDVITVNYGYSDPVPPTEVTEPSAPPTEETRPQTTEPQETEPWETAPQETAPQVTEPAETAPQETTPQETEPQVTEPKEEDPIENPFVDVFEADYYYAPVLWAVNEGITNGMDATHFAPDGTCTRAQIVTFLWRANGSPEAGGANPFTDVPADAWYTAAVLWAVEKGITTGTSATTFSPDAGCTRGQVATFLWRSQGQPAVNGENIFTDIAPGAYYYDAVLWAVANGITNGMGEGLFAPDATCTRGQIVTFLYRAMV